MKNDKLIHYIEQRAIDRIKVKFNSDYTNIEEVEFFYHNFLFSIFSSLNSYSLFKKENIDYDQLIELKIVPLYLIDFIKNNNVKKDLEQAIDIYKDNPCSLNELRQLILNNLLVINKTNVFYNNVDKTRKLTGSYYTPKQFARNIIEKTINNEKQFNINKHYKIADFSCGGGEFLIEAINHLNEKYNIQKNIAACYVYGFDVDPIALQIAKCSILCLADKKDYKEISTHFVLCNPLLENKTNNSSEEIKNRLFSCGRIYSTEFGITSNNINSSFDYIFGNPPWEKIRFEEKSFFSRKNNEIAKISKKSSRSLKINELKNNWKELYSLYENTEKDYKKLYDKNSINKFISKSLTGELNTYALFTELCYNYLSSNGHMALIVKTTIFSSFVYNKLWNELVKYVECICLYDNSKKIFDIDARERFMIVNISKKERNDFLYAAGLKNIHDIINCKTIKLNLEAIKLINPLTGMLPYVTRNEDIQLLNDANKKYPTFFEVYPDCHYGRLVHLTLHAKNIQKIQTKTNTGIYEGKFIEQYNGRFSTFKDVEKAKKYSTKAYSKKIENPETELPVCRYYINNSFWKKISKNYLEEFTLYWRSLSSSTNKRTMIATILPTLPTCQSLQLLQVHNKKDLLIILALFNSVVFDYFVRLKMPGIDLTQSVICQIPVPKKDVYNKKIIYKKRNCKLETHILSYVCYLLSFETRLTKLINVFKNEIYDIKNIDYNVAKKELDLLIKEAYELTNDEYNKILMSFPKY